METGVLFSQGLASVGRRSRRPGNLSQSAPAGTYSARGRAVVTDAVLPSAYLQQAQRALAGARLQLEAGDAEGACNRAYYAMFDAIFCRRRPSAGIACH